jgi:hypothetical protein
MSGTPEVVDVKPHSHSVARVVVAGVVALLCAFAGLTVAVMILAALSGDVINPATGAYVAVFAAGGACLVLSILVILRVLPAWVRKEDRVGIASVLANLFLIVVLWCIAVGGLTALVAN